MTILRTLCWGLVLLGAQTAWAEKPATSIMFDQSKDYSHITTSPAPQPGETQRSRCAELAARMQDLKGKPQQRAAVARQYDAECRR